MSRQQARPLLSCLVLGLALTLPSVASQEEEVRPSGLRPAERVLLERVMAESEVDRTIDRPGWGSYPRFLLEEVRRWWIAKMLAGVRTLASMSRGLGMVATVTIWTAGAVVTLFLVTWIVGVLRRRRQPAQRVDVVSDLPAESNDWGAPAWRREVEERLVQGRVPEALEALWWWLARSLVGLEVDDSWTSRELGRSVGRHELTPLLATLDSMAFGPRRPGAQEVRTLLQSLEGLVP